MTQRVETTRLASDLQVLYVSDVDRHHIGNVNSLSLRRFYFSLSTAGPDSINSAPLRVDIDTHFQNKARSLDSVPKCRALFSQTN